MVTFFFIIFIYLVSLVMAIMKKKLGDKVKRIFKVINISALIITVILILMWTGDMHLYDLDLEIIPFWSFIVSSIMIFGLTSTNKIEKVVYGIVFFGHLALSVILVIPFIGAGINSMVYSHFLAPYPIYENGKVIVTDDNTGFLSAKGSPAVYIKSGIFSHRFQTSIAPVYSIDSVTLIKIDEVHVKIKIHSDKENFLGENTEEIVNCVCLEPIE